MLHTTKVSSFRLCQHVLIALHNMQLKFFKFKLIIYMFCFPITFIIWSLEPKMAVDKFQHNYVWENFYKCSIIIVVEQLSHEKIISILNISSSRNWLGYDFDSLPSSYVYHNFHRLPFVNHCMAQPFYHILVY